MVLQSYEAIYDHGRMQWLREKPAVARARVIVTVIPSEEGGQAPVGGTPLKALAGGLEHSPCFAGSPMKIQEALRNEWD